MKVFLSWSGFRSKAVAEILGKWLEQVIQAVEPWISTGIAKGTRWQTEVADKLDEAKIGIVCLTSGNLNAPWILFEAGALSKKAKESYVCTFLLDVTPTDVEPPLGDFQHTVFTKDDMKRLVATINNALAGNEERTLRPDTLDALFEKFWPELDAKLKAVISQPEEKPEARKDRDLLEEILELLRSQEQRRLAADRLREFQAKLRAGNPEFIRKRFGTAKVGTSPQSLELIGRALKMMANQEPPSEEKGATQDTNTP